MCDHVTKRLIEEASDHCIRLLVYLRMCKRMITDEDNKTVIPEMH